MLVRDRTAARQQLVEPWPGQAEYLDLLRAVTGLAGNAVKDQLAMLKTVAEYTLRKHAGSDPAD